MQRRHGLVRVFFSPTKHGRTNCLRYISEHLLEKTGFRIDNEASHCDILWYQWVSADGFDCETYRLGGILETFKPVVQIDATWQAPQWEWATTMMLFTPNS